MRGSNLNAYELARLDDEIASPDRPDSAGAVFLLAVQAGVNDAIEYAGTIDDIDDTAHEIADAAVPVYTHELLVTLVDLAAYAVDTSEFGAPATMDQAAGWALYTVALRIAAALLADELEEAGR